MDASKLPSLERLIGTWEFESSVDGRAVARGSTTFEWLENGAFVLQRADGAPEPDAPAEWAENWPMPVIAVIGFDDATGGHAMLYTDARGVFRIYQMRLTGDTWIVWRDAPGFFQRFIGTFDDNGRTITGRWESSPDGSTWQPDFDMTYRKA